MSSTTIEIKKDVKTHLERYKINRNESYNDVIERLLEDLSRLNGKTQLDIKRARKEIAAGKFKTHEQLGKEMGFCSFTKQ